MLYEFVVRSCACFLQACVLDRESEDEKYKSVEEGPTSDVSTGDQSSKSTLTAVKLAWCVVGLQISYLTWGVLQERIMTREYDGETFNTSQFLVFINRILAFVIAGNTRYYMSASGYRCQRRTCSPNNSP